MARIRSLHPGQWTDGDFVQCSPLARLLALGLRNEADDQGIFEWKPVEFKMRLMPIDNVDMNALLAELVEHQQVARFEHDGKQYGAVRNFCQYQRPKKPKAVHFIPPEFRTYVALNKHGGELIDDEPAPVPKKAEVAPQMKEEGGRRLDEGGSGRREGVQGEGVSPPDGGSGAPNGASKLTKVKRKSRLDAEFVIELESERYAYAHRCGMTDDQMEIECEKFENHHKAKGNLMADWDAAWRTWVRNWQTYSQARRA